MNILKNINSGDTLLSSRTDKIYAKFEPIVDKNLEVYSNEILFRLNGKDNSHIEFLTELREKKETFSLFTRITTKAFNEIVLTGKSVNVNLEVLDVMNPDFLTFLKKSLLIYKVDPSKINFELLEYEDIKDKDAKLIIGKIKEINNLGFLFSIDDLYSGFSNKKRINILLYHGIKISTVKVDGKFLQEMFFCYKNGFELPDIIKHDGEKVFKHSLKDFDDFKKYLGTLHSKGIKVIAEWIENDDMFEFAKELGFDYFQGYYIQNLNNHIQEI